MSKTIIRNILLGLSLISITACEPEVRLKSISQQQNHVSLAFGMDIKWQGMRSASPVSARMIHKYNAAISFPVELTEKPDEKFSYELRLNQPPAGDYRIIISVPYRKKFLGISLWESQKVIYRDFTVFDTLPPNCFGFDDQETAIKGWQVSNVFIDNKEDPVSKATCPGLFFVKTSWPWSLDKTSEGGSLFVPVSSDCFPKVSSQSTKKSHWSFTITSPDLSAHSNWQNIRAVQFRIATKNIPIQVSPSLVYQSVNNPDVLKLDTRVGWRDIAGDQWYIIDAPVNTDQSLRLLRFNIEITGVPEETVGSVVNSIFIDGVCPVK